MLAHTEPGCNGAGAVITLESGRVVHHFSAATTLMGCSGVGEAMDEWSAALLASGPSLQLDGDRLSVRADSEAFEMTAFTPPTPVPQAVPTQSVVPGGNCAAVAATLANRVIELTADGDLQAFRDTGRVAAPAESLAAWRDAVAAALPEAECDPAPLLTWTVQDAYPLALDRFGNTQDAEDRYALLEALLAEDLPPAVPLFVPTVPPTEPAVVPHATSPVPTPS